MAEISFQERIWFVYQNGFPWFNLKMTFCGGVPIPDSVLFPEDRKISSMEENHEENLLYRK